MPSGLALRFSLILASIGASAACGAVGTPTIAASPEATTQSATATAQVATATATAPSSIPVLAPPIKFMIPPGLATAANAEPIDAMTTQTGAPWDVAPAHLQVALLGYSVQGSFHVPQVLVYPVPEYVAANPSAAESIKRLQTVLANPNGSYTADSMPHIPFFNAGQVFAAQVKPLEFGGGSGLRAVTQYGQDVSPINNGSLFYLFEGLSQDGKYYIVAILPTNSPYLSHDNSPGSPVPAGGIPFPDSNASGSSFLAYYQQTTELLDRAAAHQFDPDLDALDALVKSISIQP